MTINLKELKGMLDGAGYHLLPQDHETEIRISGDEDNGTFTIEYVITVKDA